MDCLICQASTRRQTRVACDECLKPVCNNCFLELKNKSCPNCRSDFALYQSLSLQHQLYQMYQSYISPVCHNSQTGLAMYDRVDNSNPGNNMLQCSGKLRIVRHGLSSVISCQLHSFECSDCDTDYSNGYHIQCNECNNLICIYCAKNNESGMQDIDNSSKTNWLCTKCFHFRITCAIGNLS